MAVWHILTYEAADRHADEKSVAASFINLAYKMGTKNLLQESAPKPLPASSWTV